MYNNDVTYDEKWNTPENKAALEKLDKKFFDKSICAPSCPVGWAPEVLEMLETVERELGFKYNEGTLRSYYVQGNALNWFVTDPWKAAFRAIKHNFFFKPDPKKTWQTNPRTEYSVWNRLGKIVSAWTHPYKYGARVARVVYLNPILNKIYKPKVSLDQIKEKYGQLNLYFKAPDCYEEYIEDLVRKTKIKLAIKGCYYPIETMWDSGVGYWVGNEHDPDTIAATPEKDGSIYVRKTTCRKAMKELGLDLKDIERKYNEYVAKKAAQQP